MRSRISELHRAEVHKRHVPVAAPKVLDDPFRFMQTQLGLSGERVGYSLSRRLVRDCRRARRLRRRSDGHRNPVASFEADVREEVRVVGPPLEPCWERSTLAGK